MRGRPEGPHRSQCGYRPERAKQGSVAAEAL